MKEVKSHQYISPQVFFHKRAIVYPIGNFNLSTREFDGGVVKSSGETCSLSLHRKSGFENIGPDSSVTHSKFQNGIFLYGGMLQNEHFGHFLIESLSRLWASNHIARIDGVIFVKRVKHIGVAKFIYDFFDLFMPDIPIYIVDSPTEFRTIIVPQQLCLQKSGVFINHPVFEPLLTKFKEKINISKSKVAHQRKLYVSRTGLANNEGQILGERMLEQQLELEGYYIMHPQKLTILEQLELYINAEKIIFADGSAYHLYVLVASREQNVFVVWRRKKPHDFDCQLFSFTAKVSKGKPALKGFYTPKGKPHISSNHIARINFDDLKMQLISEEFIIGDEWLLIDENEIDKELCELEIKRKEELHFFPGVNK